MSTTADFKRMMASFQDATQLAKCDTAQVWWNGVLGKSKTIIESTDVSTYSSALQMVSRSIEDVCAKKLEALRLQLLACISEAKYLTKFEESEWKALVKDITTLIAGPSVAKTQRARISEIIAGELNYATMTELALAYEALSKNASERISFNAGILDPLEVKYPDLIKEAVNALASDLTIKDDVDSMKSLAKWYRNRCLAMQKYERASTQVNYPRGNVSSYNVSSGLHAVSANTESMFEEQELKMNSAYKAMKVTASTTASNESSNTENKKSVCFKFVAGKCKRDKCRFTHDAAIIKSAEERARKNVKGCAKSLTELSQALSATDVMMLDRFLSVLNTDSNYSSVESPSRVYHTKKDLLFMHSKWPRREGYTYFMWDTGSEVNVMHSRPENFKCVIDTKEEVRGISGSVVFNSSAPTRFGEILVSPAVKVNLMSLHALEKTHVITYVTGSPVKAVCVKTGKTMYSEKFSSFWYFAISNDELFNNESMVIPEPKVRVHDGNVTVRSPLEPKLLRLHSASYGCSAARLIKCNTSLGGMFGVKNAVIRQLNDCECVGCLTAVVHQQHPKVTKPLSIPMHECVEVDLLEHFTPYGKGWLLHMVSKTGGLSIGCALPRKTTDAIFSAVVTCLSGYRVVLPANRKLTTLLSDGESGLRACSTMIGQSLGATCTFLRPGERGN